MPNYADIIPVDHLERKFGELEHRIIARNTTELRKSLPAQIPGICMFIWDEMVDRGLVRDPYKIGPIIHRNYKGIYEFVSRELGREAIDDAFAEKYFNKIDPSESFVDFSIARCFPDDLHIVDIELSDNTRPLARTDPSREFRQYHGLHLFGEVLERIRAVAREEGVSRLSLMVAHAPLHHVFSRHGFKVGKSVMAQAAYQQVGFGHSMYLEL